MAPLRSSSGQSSFAPTALSRKSMPDLPNSASASISNIYPSLPSLNEVTSLLHLPGSCPPAPPTPKRFVFGTRSNDGISRNQFSAAAEEVLAQMNARLPSNAGKISQGLLQGKKIEVDRLVSVNKQLGENGWGLGASTSSAKADRYANAHEKEFARMQSISRLHPLAATDGDRKPKRSRMSVGPSVLGSLREGSCSLANLLADNENKPSPVKLKQLEEKRDQRRASVMRGKGTGLSSRFGFLRSLRKHPMPASPAAEIVTIGGPAYFPAPTMPRKTSVYAPRDPPRQRKKFDLQGSLRRSQTTTHLKSSELSSSTKPMSGLPQISDNLAGDERWRSTSAQTVLSTGSRTQLRPKLPDFGPTARLDSTINTLGLPKPSSMSSSHSMKKQSQFDLIRSARTVPLPPTDERRKPAKSTAPSLVRSSTLYAPTASSLARMQATVKPTSDRPLPVPPTPAVPRFPTSKPFGAASSRNNLLFESNLHNVPKPVHKSISHQTSSRSIASPTKARLRAKASGLSAMKSKGNLRGEVEVQQRRAEIKARQERLAEERGLREMLSGGMSGADMVIS